MNILEKFVKQYKRDIRKVFRKAKFEVKSEIMVDNHFVDILTEHRGMIKSFRINEQILKQFPRIHNLYSIDMCNQFVRELIERK